MVGSEALCRHPSNPQRAATADAVNPVVLSQLNKLVTIAGRNDYSGPVNVISRWMSDASFLSHRDHRTATLLLGLMALYRYPLWTIQNRV